MPETDPPSSTDTPDSAQRSGSAGRDTSADRRPFKISRLTYVVPFGRYVGSSQVSPQADEVLVGRTGHRAYFIDLLISAGRRGAFLVTGRRGAGKTSFVQHCISEYEASVFKRFLRHNVGRAFWDRVLVLLFWAVVLLAGLLLSETAELLAAVSRHGPHGMLLWVVLLPIGITLLFPCVYARAAVEVVLDTIHWPWSKRAEGSRTNNVAATVLVLLAVALAWYTPGLSSPAWTASALLTLLSAFYLGAQAASFTRPWVHLPQNHLRRIALFLGKLALAVIPGLMAFWTLVVLAPGPPVDKHYLWARALPMLKGALAVNVFASLCMLSGGLFLRGWYQRGAAVRLFRAQQEEESQPEEDHPDPIRSALRRGGMNYLIPGVAFFLAAGWLGFAMGAHEALWMLPAGTLVMVGVGMLWVLPGWQDGRRTPGAVFVPRPRLSLIAGALISVVISIQLAQPILQPVFTRAVDPVAEFIAKHVDPFADSIAKYVGPAVRQVPGLKLVADQNREMPAPLSSVRGLTGDSKSARGTIGRPVAVFWYRYESLYWLGLVVLAAALLHFIQYEWVIRPSTTQREDGPLDAVGHAPWGDSDFLSGTSGCDWRSHRKVADLTLPWAVYRVWLPKNVILVNLGFDSKLGAGQVIQAMLVGLREQYQKTFTSWSAWQANIRRIGAFLAVVVLATLAGDTWFRLPSAKEITTWTTPAATKPESACGILARTHGARSTRLPDLVCRLGPGWFDFLYLDLVPRQVAETSQNNSPHPWNLGNSTADRLLLYTLLPYRDKSEDTPEGAKAASADQGGAQTGEASGSKTPSQAMVARWEELFPPGLHLNVYHLILLLTLVFLYRAFQRKLPLLAYRKNLQRIDDLLDAMSARTRIRRGPPLWEPARWIYSIVTESVRETEREPLDPRTVELAFLQILEEIQRGSLRMPGIARNHLNVPAPEITFVFDELDKLGTRLDPEDDRGITSLATELRAVQADQERALKLRGLLSDLKNVLSSAPARFIFIGGRNLHDEWLADQTARQPLLTNIFIAEVYLPSLLTDRSQKYRASTLSDMALRSHHLHTRIDEFALYQYRRAAELYRELVLKDFRPSFALRSEALVAERFASQPPKESLREALQLYCSQPNLPGEEGSGNGRGGEKRGEGGLQKLEPPEAEELVADFVGFLTLRSMGNPKRLKELLASFVRPLSQEVGPPDRWRLACRHVLRFRDVEIFRVQLIAAIYRHLAGGLEGRMVGRDDKTAISVFFLSDFIFKFHRRAFSWSNLERVDELAHIHRAPDLRDVQEEMVNLFSERFLHRVLNGMYSFRFRSDVAREVEFLSRLSPAEMAALNFTLDESQTLKARYHDSLEQREKKAGTSPTLVAGLGELYEFDQEYEAARHYYQRAIDILDDKLCKKTGSPTSVRQLLLGEHDGMDDARVFLPWGEARLRLMLQIGMTFEIARSLEHAVTEYRAARTLARALVKACLALDAEAERSDEKMLTGRFHTLKHLNILFQPIFAEAWASEKITSTVDTSNRLIEAGLWEVRKILPFVKTPQLRETKDPTKPSHANLALTMSQLHNKAGDLYFFKGREPVPWSEMVDGKIWSSRSGTPPTSDGYLLRAHYHYAVSLHEIRRYAYHRAHSSRYRLGLGDPPEDTLRTEQLPDFLCRAVASSVSDMAEAALGRVSLFGLARSLDKKTRKVRGEKVQDLEDEVLTWLGLDDRRANARRKLWAELGHGVTVSLGDRSNWLGKWTRPKRRRFENSKLAVIEFDEPDGPTSRFVLAVQLCRAGARLFQRGGYLEDAARELLQVCWIVMRMLWWIRTLTVLRTWAPKDKKKTEKSKEGARDPGGPAWIAEIGSLENAVFRSQDDGSWTSGLLQCLAELAYDVLYEANTLFRQCRHRLHEPDPSGEAGHVRLLGDLLPPEALTLACGLSFFLETVPEPGQAQWSADLRKKLLDLAKTWDSKIEDLSPERLYDTLKRFRYPLLNRLNGLELLINDLVLNRWTTADATTKQDGVVRLEELLDLSEQYAAPHHFTPQQSGTTCALFWLRWQLAGPPSDPEQQRFLDQVYRTAQRDLRASEEMFTLQRSYYESISDLFYLYDDFNDRHVHFKHALQMASAELTAVLRHLLEVAGRPEGAPKRRESGRDGRKPRQ